MPTLRQGIYDLLRSVEIDTKEQGRTHVEPWMSQKLVIDAVALQSNIERMAHTAAAHKVALRPHSKTHKSPAIARRQLAAGELDIGPLAFSSFGLAIDNAHMDDLRVICEDRKLGEILCYRQQLSKQ